jgi:uncharacterized protein YutE (UPF0331/DUF86 family)
MFKKYNDLDNENTYSDLENDADKLFLFSKNLGQYESTL